MSAAIIFGLLFALMLTGMPISISLGLTVLTFLFTMTQVPIESVALKLFTGIENFQIMAIPFFILAGAFLTHGGVARRMIAFTTSLVGHWAGGLGLAGVVACALFAAIAGSSVATVVAIGSIILPAMVEHGFPRRFGAGVITTSGALGILVPPSIILVLYGVSTNTSIGALFMAGVVPGVTLATALALLNAANMSAMLLYIITNAVLFSFLMTSENIPQAMAAWMIGKQFSPWVFLLVVNILLLAAGNVMEPSSILLIMAPILFPIITKLGIDPVHFGILMAVNMEVGLCHPPVGLNLYVASGIARMGISELTMAVLPWLVTMLFFLAVVTYWPTLSLWLPHLLGVRY